MSDQKTQRVWTPEERAARLARMDAVLARAHAVLDRLAALAPPAAGPPAAGPPAAAPPRTVSDPRVRAALARSCRTIDRAAELVRRAMQRVRETRAVLDTARDRPNHPRLTRPRPGRPFTPAGPS